MRHGAVAAIGAYILWGLLPLYMHLVFYMPVFEVLAHRIIWAFPTVFLILAVFGGIKETCICFRRPKILSLCALTAVMITCNWGSYIWAIVNNHTLEAALGYYITPLFNILLGSFVLKERLTLPQWISFVIAAVAVLILAIDAGSFPWVALIISVTFSLYGFFKKSIPLSASCGFAIEASLLFFPALAVALYYVYIGKNHFAAGPLSDDLLLIGMGPLTAIPLILYATGAKKLTLSALGIMQYITPTLVFLVAVFVLKEEFTWIQFWAFVLIWISIIIYTTSNILQQKANKKLNLSGK